MIHPTLGPEPLCPTLGQYAACRIAATRAYIEQLPPDPRSRRTPATTDRPCILSPRVAGSVSPSK